MYLFDSLKDVAQEYLTEPQIEALRQSYVVARDAHAIWPDKMRTLTHTSAGARNWVEVETHNSIETAITELKAQGMQEFKDNKLHLLVATTVIEVGVDVPNSSLMIIENPERLGLAQLHQLRGRVGRGSVASHCVLLYHSPLSKTAQKRLGVLRESNDGFVIAQKDLEIRGPGELLGTKQTGLADFKIADLVRDQRLIPEVQRIARHIHDNYPTNAAAIIDRWLGERDIYSKA